MWHQKLEPETDAWNETLLYTLPSVNFAGVSYFRLQVSSRLEKILGLVLKH